MNPSLLFTDHYEQAVSVGDHILIEEHIHDDFCDVEAVVSWDKRHGCYLWDILDPMMKRVLPSSFRGVKKFKKLSKTPVPNE